MNDRLKTALGVGVTAPAPSDPVDEASSQHAAEADLERNTEIETTLEELEGYQTRCGAQEAEIERLRASVAELAELPRLSAASSANLEQAKAALAAATRQNGDLRKMVREQQARVDARQQKNFQLRNTVLIYTTAKALRCRIYNRRSQAGIIVGLWASRAIAPLHPRESELAYNL